MELSKKENDVLKMVEKYLQDNDEIKPMFLGEFDAHNEVKSNWKGYFAMWMAKGELAICTNFSLLQTLVEAVNQACEAKLSDTENERISVVLSHQVEKKYLDMNTYSMA